MDEFDRLALEIWKVSEDENELMSIAALLRERIGPLVKGLSRACIEEDYCWVCNNHPYAHSKDCALVAFEKITPEKG